MCDKSFYCTTKKTLTETVTLAQVKINVHLDASAVQLVQEKKMFNFLSTNIIAKCKCAITIEYCSSEIWEHVHVKSDTIRRSAQPFRSLSIFHIIASDQWSSQHMWNFNYQLNNAAQRFKLAIFVSHYVFLLKQNWILSIAYHRWVDVPRWGDKTKMRSGGCSVALLNKSGPRSRLFERNVAVQSSAVSNPRPLSFKCWTLSSVASHESYSAVFVSYFRAVIGWRRWCPWMSCYCEH